MTGYHIAEDRAVLRISGADRIDFLQGIVSNDVAKAGNSRGVWAAFLTPQGKYLHDFFLAADGESILLDCEKARSADLHKRLRRYTLRSDARVEAAGDLVVALALVDVAPASDLAACFPDPRPTGSKATERSAAEFRSKWTMAEPPVLAPSRSA